MNVNRVTKILNQVHRELLDSIKDEEIKKLIKRDSIITGGSITSLLINEKVKDFDLYFTNKETTLAVAKYYVNQFNARNENKFNSKMQPPIVYTQKDGNTTDGENFDRIRIKIKSAGIIGENTKPQEYEYFESGEDREGESFVLDSMKELIEEADKLDGNLIDAYENLGNKDIGDKYRPIFITDNAITLSGRIQLVIRFFGTPEEIHKNFDYVHCTNYWTSKDKKLTLNQDALQSILTKELKYVGSKYPLCSVVRLRKFVRKGWIINAGQILKICMQISKLDLENIAVLEEQLTGVDTAYFHDMINRLKKKQENDGRLIETAYVVSIIDKLFG